MPSPHLSVLLCAAALTLACTACAAIPPAQSLSTPPDLSLSEPPKPDTSAPAVSTPVPSLPNEDSLQAIFIPAPSAPRPSVSSPSKEAAPSQPPAPMPPVPDTEAPVPSETQKPEQVPSQFAAEPPVSTYDFSQPVPESAPVGTDYFADAAFVGDSRSEGFYLYGVKRGKNLSSSGLSVFTFAKKKTFSVNGTSCTALEALSQKEYGKVYLGFGVNELGYINPDAFYQSYCQTIDAVRACQPHAVVYAQTMAPVNEDRVAATGGKKHLNNDRVRLYNDLIRKAALENRVPLLDVYSALAVDGSLPADASRDGVHLSKDYCRKQLEYLKTHTVSFDAIYSQPNTETEVFPDETTDIPATSDPVPNAGADGLLTQPEQDSVPVDADQSTFTV